MNNIKKLTIMQMNDSHGYIELHPEMFIENGKETYRNAGGYARIASIFKNIRNKKNDNVLVLDNGDTFHGTYLAVASKGEAFIPIMNELQFDAMTDHWEFAYGPDQLKKLISMLNYPMLAANIYHNKTNKLVFPSHMIIKKAGLNIGIIGIAEHIVDKMMPSHFSEGIYFTLGNEELPIIIKELREQNNVDLIVLLSHFGFPQEVKLATEVDCIDILLSGHTHNRLENPVIVNDTIIIQSGCHGSFIGRLDVEVKNKKVEKYNHQLIEVAEGFEPDLHVQSLVNKALKPYREKLTSVVGSTDIALHRYTQLETTMDNLLLESLMDISDVELAFSNGWRYGAPIPKGEITVNDLWNIIPTNPPVSTVELTGAEILDMLEENLENTFSSDPYNQMRGYVKRCLGLQMYIKVENPKGMRIQNLFIGGSSVDENRTYTATFVTVQAVPKKYGTNRQNIDIHAIEALTKYIEKKKNVSPNLRDTVKVI